MPILSATAAIRSALEVVGAGGGSPGFGRGYTNPPGQPVSIKSDLPSGVRNSVAAPPSTSIETTFRPAADAGAAAIIKPIRPAANALRDIWSPSRHIAARRSPKLAAFAVFACPLDM